MPSNLTRIKNNQVTDSTIVASAKLVAGSITGGLLADPLSYSGSLTISGNLTVQGTTTIVDTTNTTVADPIIVLSRGETGTPSVDSGFLVIRGTSNNAAFLWDETNDRFQAITTTDAGTTAGSIGVAAFADIKSANLILTGGEVSTTASTFLLANATATTVRIGGAATAVNIGASTGTTIVKNDLQVDGGDLTFGSATTANIANATVTTLALGGAATAVNIGASTGTTIVKNDLQVDGGNLTFGTDTTANIANATATTVNFAGAATAVNIGAATGTTIIKNDLQVDGGDLTFGSSTTATVANATVTTLNMGGAATAVNIGAATGTTIVKNDLQVDGGDLTFGAATTANIANATVTTLNLGGAATAINMGADGTAVTTVKGKLTTAGSYGNIHLTTYASIFVDGTSTNNIVQVSSNNRTAGMGLWSTGGANGIYSTGDIQFLSGITLRDQDTPTGGSTVATISSAGIVTLTNNIVGTTTQNVFNTTSTTINAFGAATAVNIGSATGTTIVKNDLQVDGGDLTFGAATTANIANATVTTLNVGGSNGNVVIGNDLRINGNDIRSSTGNVAITLSDINVTIVGNLTVQGGTTSIGSQDLVVQDSIINLHTQPNLAPLIADDGRDIGVKMHYYKTSDKHAFVGWANDTGFLEYYSDATEGVGGTITGTYGTIKANSFYSNIATGTAPFTVNSTTQVANLNVAAAGIAETVTTAAQPNITSVGTLGNLYVNAQANATTFSSNIATGTAPFIVTSTTQVANLNVATAGSLVNGNSNVTIVANANVNISSTGTANVLVIKGTGVNVAGTLDISGVTTASSFVSNIATGTAPFTVTSTTQVANLNVAAAGIASTVTTAAQPNITSFGNVTTANIGTIQSSATNGNITLTPNGTGNVIISTGTATQLFYAGANKELTSNANLVFSGTQLTVTGTANATTVNAGNIQTTGNTVASSDTNGNVNINANGTGTVRVNSDGDNTNFIVYANTATYASGLIYAKASSGQVGILTETPTAGATLHINATNSMIVPVGTTLERPTGAAGMLRFNTSQGLLEFHDGTGWSSTAGNFTVISYTNYSGDGSTLNFTLSESSTTASTLVAINGIVQQPSTAYSVSGTTLTFTEAPLATDSIDVRLLTTTTSVSTLADGTTSIALSNSAAISTVTITGNTNTVFGNGKVTFSVPQVMDITGVSVGTTAAVIDTFPVATYRSAKYVIQVSNVGRGDYESSEVIVVHDGTTAYRAAYGVVYSNVALGTTTVTLSSGNVNVNFTGNYLGNTVKLFKQYIPV
jgi:hypothetical protein